MMNSNARGEVPGGVLLRAEGLVKRYATVVRSGMRRDIKSLTAVDGVSLSVDPGETVGIVGESGCGKSTLARLLLLLEQPTAGSIRFHDQLMRMDAKDVVRRFRREVQVVFQDPWSSLNPRMRIGALVGEPLIVNSTLGRRARAARIKEVLAEVGLDSNAMARYPHEFSGGQRQRIAIARALAMEPKLVVLDEPTSSLDVSIRGQLLNLLIDIQANRGTSFVLIAHDLAAVRFIARRVVVMYLGAVMEVAPASELFTAPLHPYTEALLKASRRRKGAADDPPPIASDPPSPYAIPSGCRFRTRCPYAFDRCVTEEPQLVDLGSHTVACHLHGPDQPLAVAVSVGRGSDVRSGDRRTARTG